MSAREPCPYEPTKKEETSPETAADLREQGADPGRTNLRNKGVSSYGTRDGEPIEREPRAVRPPYGVRDETFDHLRATDTDAWRIAVRLDRVAALREPLAGLAVTDYEHRAVEWLAGFDTATVAVFVALLHRARAAAPLDGEDDR